MKKLVLPLTIALLANNVGFAKHLIHEEFKADYQPLLQGTT